MGKRSMHNSQHVTEQNSLLKGRNDELINAKKQLQSDEEELTKMYEKWLADDGEDLALTRSQIKDLKEQMDTVQLGQEANRQMLEAKEAALADKEVLLSTLHLQLREKNSLMKQMKKTIKALNGS